MNKLTPIELGWVAGLLEGEGCFTPSRQAAKRKVYIYARVQMNMTDEDVMRRFHEIVGIGRLTGPHIYPNKPKWKPRWDWYCRNQDAKDLMLAVLPYMGERRAEAIRESLLIQDSE